MRTRSNQQPLENAVSFLVRGQLLISDVLLNFPTLQYAPSLHSFGGAGTGHPYPVLSFVNLDVFACETKLGTRLIS